MIENCIGRRHNQPTKQTHAHIIQMSRDVMQYHKLPFDSIGCFMKEFVTGIIIASRVLIFTWVENTYVDVPLMVLGMMLYVDHVGSAIYMLYYM